MLEQILEAAARSFALGGAVWLSLRVLRVHHPQARMMAWTVVLAVSLAMPVLMHWMTVTIPSRPAPPTAVIDQAYPVALPRRSPEPKELSPGRTDPLPSSERLDVDRDSDAARDGTRFAAIDWQALATGIYVVVATGLLLRLLAGLALTWRVLRVSRPLDEDWTAGLDVRESAAVGTPMTVASTILLPVECHDWRPAKRRAVLAHEANHVVRADFHVLMLATLHRALFWFSPFSWWLLNELAETAELISDDAAIESLAIESLGDPPAYAEILIEVAQSARRVSAGVAMARTRCVLRRIDRILAPTASSSPQLGRSRRVLVAVGLTPLVALSTVSFSKETMPPGAKSQVQASQARDRHSGALAVVSARPAPALWLGGGVHVTAGQPSVVAPDLFNPATEWQAVAGHTSVVQFVPTVILMGGDEDLKSAFQNLAEHKIALALEFRALERSDRCWQRTHAYSDPGDLEKILERMHRLGADLKYAVLVDPYYFGHRFSGPGSCRESPEELARQIAEKIQILRGYFPQAQIGAADVVDESKPWIDELANWADVYQQVVGEPLAFFHADMMWSRPAMRNLPALAEALRARRIRFGITYNADETPSSDETWLDSTRRNITEIESGLGIHPDDVIFRSWAPYPLHQLSRPGALTNLALQYLLARPSVNLTHEVDALSGQMLDAHGRPVPSAGLTVDALDVAGSMDAVEHHLTGKVPRGAATAVVMILSNRDGICVCAGEADASIGTIVYREERTDRREEIPPFSRAEENSLSLSAAGNAHSSVRVLHLTSAKTVAVHLRRFPVTPGADYDLSVPLAVSGNGERAGYVALEFKDDAGKGVRRDVVWFRPSVRSLGNAVTDADGRFHMEIPPRMAEAGSDIRAYYPGSASLGSQTATASR
jgi:beta-lactamase regulating signal transducer with metallopeptidase domain